MNSTTPSLPAMLSARLLALPKAEMHVHLEGSMEARELERLALDAGETLPRPAESLFRFTALADFLEFLDWSCGLVRTREHLAGIAYAFSKRLAADGAGYTDAIVNPAHWPAWRSRMGEMIDALDGGFRAAEEDGLPPVGLCVSVLRQASAEEALQLVEALVAMRHPRVVALSKRNDDFVADIAATSIDASFAPTSMRSGLSQALAAWRVG